MNTAASTPTSTSVAPSSRGPLQGLRVVELASIGPGPLCAMLLADLGADVVRIDRPEPSDLGVPVPARFDVLGRNRRSLALDLKSPVGRDVALGLVSRADVLIEGWRPGVAERLGLGPAAALAQQPGLVYGRMTGYGQAGPLAQAAGHDINYLALTGALHAIGEPGRGPVPPLNLVADFGGGALYLALGILASLFERQRSGLGQVVDAAMVDGTASLMAMTHGLAAAGAWDAAQRGANLLDGGAPFYACYATADGRWLAVGALEAKFFAELLQRIGLDRHWLSAHGDRAQWPALRAALAARFAELSRADWCALLEGTDACVAPVLRLDEAPDHAHARARGTYTVVGGVAQPAPAPRFGRTPAAEPLCPPEPGADSVAVLAEAGWTADAIQALIDDGVLRQHRAADAPAAIDADAQGARQAASVILLRDAPRGSAEDASTELQVLLLRRAERAGDLRSGVWVFPGGVLDPADRALQAHCDGDDDAAASQRMGLPEGGLDYVAAALRECFEEVGILLADAPGPLPGATERAHLKTGADFLALCSRQALRLRAGDLVYHSHWLTPPGVPKRFDTRFFVARMPDGQVAVVDDGEVVELAWLTPAQALSREAGLKLLPVTRRTLQDLGRFVTVQDCLDEARGRRQPPRMMPRRACNAQGEVRPVLPDEWAWAEIGRLDPSGQGHVCHELVPGRMVQLSPRVQRIPCDNGSVMTGPGTNTYLIRAVGSDEVAVLDPGPDDAHTEAHLQAVLAAAAPGRITRILVTHTHRDHSPAARRLAELTGAPCIGRLAAHAAWQDSGFVPDIEPQDGDRLVLGPGCSLRALHTPGHASNHLCWWLEEEGLLFTGDHVMQGSTVVINPPDGDMAAYLQQLDRLQRLPLAWLAPGHGFLMARPRQALAALVQHRLGRERKVLQALQGLAEPASAQALVPTVYGDVPASRHGIAERSLLAHLHKLASEGRAVVDDADRWHPAPPGDGSIRTL